MNNLQIYTDGSASGNGTDHSKGSFAVVVVKDNKIIDIYTSDLVEDTTNNREEMKAILWALENYGNADNPPDVYSDSSYAVNTFEEWMWGWKARGWKKADKKIPENLDLVKKYDIIIMKGKKSIELYHVKGHADNPYNNIADLLATKKKVKSDYIKE